MDALEVEMALAESRKTNGSVPVEGFEDGAEVDGK